MSSNPRLIAPVTARSTQRRKGIKAPEVSGSDSGENQEISLIAPPPQSQQGPPTNVLGNVESDREGHPQGQGANLARQSEIPHNSRPQPPPCQDVGNQAYESILTRLAVGTRQEGHGPLEKARETNDSAHPNHPDGGGASSDESTGVRSTGRAHGSRGFQRGRDPTPRVVEPPN